MRFTLAFIFLLLTSTLIGQKTGQVNYPTLGVSFTIPNGWVGQEGEGVFIMGSNSIPGLILLSTSTAQSMEAIRQEAQAGLVDPNAGINLQLSSALENLAANAVGGEFSGILENQQAKAYMIGVHNPHGQSVLIMATTLTNMYNEQYPAVAKQVFKSLKFSTPVVPPVVNDWKERLSGTRLTYMESYTSMDYSDPNFTSGGGYSKEEKIDLCPEGFFNYNDSFDVSVSTPGVSGLGVNSGQGAGNWNIIADAQGQPVLQLSFHSGEVYEYVLTREGDKTFLNGNRYYRTWTGENAPVCR